MNEATLKTLIRCKLELAHALIDLLPEALQEPIRNTEQEILRTLQVSLKDFLEESNMESNTVVKGKGLKTIEVEG